MNVNSKRIKDIYLPLRIAICEDDIEDRKKLIDLIDGYKYYSDYIINDISVIDSESLADENLLSSFDLYFLDIEMPLYSGLDIAEMIRKKKTSNKAKIVFVTNYPEYMQDSFSVHPYQYLQKPIDRKKIYNVLDSVIDEYYKDDIYITFTTNEDSYQSVNVNDIIYIKSENARRRLLKITTTDSTFLAKGVLADYEKKLKEYKIVPSYRGCLVNILFIHYLDKDEIVLKDGSRLPASSSNLQTIRKLFVERVINQHQ